MRACSKTAAQNSALNLARVPNLALDPDLDVIGALGDDLVDLGARLLGCPTSGSGAKRYFTVKTLAPRSSPLLLCFAHLNDFVRIGRHAGRGGDAVQCVLAQLRLGFRADVAVRIDDARHDELAGEIDTVAPAGAGVLGAGPMSRIRPFSITMVMSFCGGAPVPSITVARLSTITCAGVLAGSNRVVPRKIKMIRIRMALTPSYPGI